MAARVLIVEDNQANMDLMCYLLAAFGHTPLSAYDGLQGVPSCRQEQPELRDAGNGHRVACHFYETLPKPEAASMASTSLGKLPERLAAFEAAKAARNGSGAEAIGPDATGGRVSGTATAKTMPPSAEGALVHFAAHTKGALAWEL
eukprot:gene737-974_t